MDDCDGAHGRLPISATALSPNPVAAGENIDRREQARIMFGTLAEPWNLRCPQLINSLDSC
jgi:hypothetical protein